MYINGFAVRGPGFRAASELFEKLLEKRDLSTETLSGKELFDHEFFQISAQQARDTDPQIRFLLELRRLPLSMTIDCGSLQKSNVGMFIG